MFNLPTFFIWSVFLTGIIDSISMDLFSNPLLIYAFDRGMCVCEYFWGNNVLGLNLTF